MKFIELKEGLSVKMECIESIQFNEEDGGSIVTMESGNIHTTAFQFIQLLQIIEMNNKQEQKSELAGQFFNG